MKEEHQERQPGQRHVGCTACIKKLQRHDNGIWPATLKVLAEGAHPCHCIRTAAFQQQAGLSLRHRSKTTDILLV